MNARAAAALALIACGGHRAAPAPEAAAEAETETAAEAAAAAETEAESADADAAPAVPAAPAVAAVTDPAALAVVEAAGGSFAALVGARYPAIAAVIRADIDAIAAADPRAGVGIRKHPHRLFDARWLDAGSFELVGVVNRIDRLGETPGRCGDVRLIYRLGYRAGDNAAGLASRLPMTAAVVLRGQPRADGCAAAARSWKRRASDRRPPGAWLVAAGGPLAGALDAGRVDSVLTNVQAVRWPAGVHPDLGGHTEYLFREFAPDAGGTLAPVALRSVPDVARVRRSAKLRARLRAWVRDPATVAAIDRGVVALPRELRAGLSRGFTPRGFSRRANRPFRALLEPGVFDGVDLSGARIARSPAALLRRLDELTCGGCHQARSVAGFHLLGRDRSDVTAGNALASPMSAQLASELERRRRITEALAAGESPDLAPPFAERPPGSPGLAGSACGLGDPGFAGWTCGAGLECARLDAPAGAAVGRCATPGTAALGEACEVGAIRPGRDARGDRVPARRAVPCADGLICKGNKKGFPLGLCTSSCDPLPAGGACALIAGDGFNQCLVSGAPFDKCVTDTAMPIGVAGCGPERPCRDDYVCVRALGGETGCLPPYFLFQLRVDGHPGPTPGSGGPAGARSGP